MRKYPPTILGAALGIVGCFLPWITVSAGCRSKSLNGLDAPDGKYFLGMFVLILVASYFTRAHQKKLAMGASIFNALMGFGAALGSYFTATDIEKNVRAVSKLVAPLKFSTGYGVWMVVVGSLIIMVWSIWEIFKIYSTEWASPTPIAPQNALLTPLNPASHTQNTPNDSSSIEDDDNLSIPLSGGTPQNRSSSTEALESTPNTTALKPHSPLDMVVCPACGTKAEKEMPFCPNCAEPL